MNVTVRSEGYLVVMVDWTNGCMVPIADAVSQDAAEETAAAVILPDNDAVVYVLPRTAYAR